MIIHTYAICWNEIALLPYFLRHYAAFADHIFIYDNGSDDGSQELILAHPKCTLRHFNSNGEAREDLEVQVKETAWYDSRNHADWVVTCDMDEFLYSPVLLPYLHHCQQEGITLPCITGYQMISPHFPITSNQIYDEIQSGVSDSNYSKAIILNPNAIQHLNYGPGCHTCNPQGAVVRDCLPPHLKLLHYKMLGLDYFLQRTHAIAARKSTYDKEHGYGCHYFYTDVELISWFNMTLDKAKPITG